MELPTLPDNLASKLNVHGRGAAENPPNRFEPIALVPDFDEVPPEDRPAPTTQFIRDTSRTVICKNDSPDVGFGYSVNPYRGCEHGCIYCYARPTHEYFGLSSGLDFETMIFVKEDAPELLRNEFNKKSWTGDTLSFSGVTDCYQPIERRLKLTRRLIEVCREYNNPVGCITKNHLITRDTDLLSDMARDGLAAAFISVTTLDADVSAKMEPRTSSPKRRLEAIRTLSSAGVPVGVMVSPVIPGLTDHEIPMILEACADAGAITAGYVPVRLPFQIKDLFQTWLARHFPDRKDKILNRIRELRGGKLNDSNFHTRMRGEGVWAEQLKTIFDLAKRKTGLDGAFPHLTSDKFKRPSGPQMTLW